MQKHFQVDPDSILSKSENAIGHSLVRMIENHTAQAGFYWRYGLNMPEFYGHLIEPVRDAFPPVAITMFKYVQPFGMRLKARMHGIGRHTDEEIAAFSNEDLQVFVEIFLNYFGIDYNPDYIEETRNKQSA